MPTYILRRSRETAEYLLWSTVVDAPVSQVMTRDEALAEAAAGLRVDADLAEEQARRRLARTDDAGSSEATDPSYGYDATTLWWREGAPDSYGTPAEIEDAPGTYVGRHLTRDEVFDACRATPTGTR